MRANLGARTSALGILAVATLAVLAWLLVASATRSHPQQDMIAFVRDRSIVVANADGSDQHVVGAGFEPVWSPDGRRIAFVHATTRGAPLAVVDADGTHLRVLTTDHVDGGATWSPDGRRIAFSCFGTYCTAGSGVYVVSPEGGAPQHVLSRAKGPAWLSGGKGIAASVESASQPHGGLGITSLVTHSLKLVPRLWVDTPIVASPGGGQVAFNASLGPYSTAPRQGIYVARSDGSGVRELVATATPSTLVEWSPDARRLMIAGVAGAAIAIFDVAAGRRVHVPAERVMARTGKGLAPSWSPDGRSLAFVRAGRTICVTNSDSCLTSYVAVTVRLDGTGERVIGRVDAPLLTAGVTWQP